MSASCCGSARRYAALVVLPLVVIAVVAWAIPFTKRTPPGELVPTSVEMIEVVVAANDLTLGTGFTQGNVDKLTTSKTLQRDALPEGFVTNKNELVGQRLFQNLSKDAVIHPGNASRHHPPLWEESNDIMTLPFLLAGSKTPIWPGARVDLVGSIVDGKRREEFTLLPDLYVLEIDAKNDFGGRGGFPEVTMVSFAVNEQQAKIIVLANQRNCDVKLLLRHPDSPKRSINHEKTFAKLQELSKSLEETRPVELEPEVAPAPRVKGGR